MGKYLLCQWLKTIMVYWNLSKSVFKSKIEFDRMISMYMDIEEYIDNLVSWDFYYNTFGIDTSYFHGMGFTRDEYLYFLEFGSLDGFSV